MPKGEGGGMKRLCFFILVVFLTVQISNIAFAGRPLTTDDVWTVEPGHAEFEAGAEYLKYSNSDKEYSVYGFLTVGIIWDRLDFGVGVPYLWLRPDGEENENGFSDLEAIAKLRFIDETENFPALAVTVGVKTDTGDEEKGLGTGKTDFIANFIATKEIGNFVLDGNVGYNYRGDPAEETC